MENRVNTNKDRTIKLLNARIDYLTGRFGFRAKLRQLTLNLIDKLTVKTPKERINSIKADAILQAADRIKGTRDGRVCWQILINTANEIKNNDLG